MLRTHRAVLTLLLVFLLVPFLASCTALQEIANLRNVDFSIDNVTQTQLAGVDMQGNGGYEDLNALEIARVGATLATGRMPLSFTLNLGASNPETNTVNARLVQLDWTLLLDNTETISGIFNDERVIPPGADVLIPISMELDLVDFFGSNLADIVNLVGAIAGEGSSEIALRARPTVTTPIGPITYPSEITIVSQQIGE